MRTVDLVLSVTTVALSLSLWLPLKVLAASNARKIQFLNEGKGRVEVYWVHPQTEELSLMSSPDIMPGADFVLDSYVTHEFLVREKKCRGPNDTCRSCKFAVSSNDEQILHITEEVKCHFIDNKVKAQEEAQGLVKACHANALANSNAEKALEELVSCVQAGVSQRLELIQEEIAFQSTVRRDIAANLENYTCADDTLNSSKFVSEQIWIHDGAMKKPIPRRHVAIMHNRPASRIHVVSNFIDEEECQAMEDAAVPLLHRATVADGRGGSQLSNNRKAMQAGIKVPWELEKKGNPIARLSRRVYDYTNDVLGLNIAEFGQEDLMSIQYFGRGINDTEPDRYTPHCDGDCTGLGHKSGTRMATMVMYCKVADRGGHTNFRNAGVHVKPQVGDAVFFSYIDPATLTMDTGFTEHSGCPVYEGSKKIVTQWIRLGVDTENPWDSFNTLGIKYKDVQALDEEEDAEEGYGDEEEDDESNDEF